jgi:hypothetical protein
MHWAIIDRGKTRNMVIHTLWEAARDVLHAIIHWRDAGMGATAIHSIQWRNIRWRTV